MAGFIYIMSNPAFPDLIKIGKSAKDPTKHRKSELYETGVPQPFKVEYYAFVEDEDYLEQRVHSYFNTQRPNKNREFFSVGCAEAIDTIRKLSDPYSKIKYEEVFFIYSEKTDGIEKQQDYEVEPDGWRSQTDAWEKEPNVITLLKEEAARNEQAEEEKENQEEQAELEAKRKKIEAEVARRKAEDSEANRILLSSMLLFAAIGTTICALLGILPYEAGAAAAAMLIIWRVVSWTN